MFNFNDQVVIVTGANGGLGQAVAQAFLEAGARLALVGRSLERLQEAFPDEDAASRLLFLVADVTDETAVEGLVYEVNEQLGHIDVLVNVAGGFRAGAPVHEMPLNTWDFMLDLNARSVLNTCRAVIPHMLQQGSGKIINIASRSALQGAAGQSAYSASKAAVVRLTESMAAELQGQGINVNCLVPGAIDTPGNRRAMPGADFSRWVAPEALAQIILFLASDLAWPIQGATIPAFGDS